ncbi:MAG: glycosyltransferase family 4 protein [Candidatus Sericytochromatia bacterium]|nr:glycosyltransferase family 4 protein [Candidatus Sericytochromatia bacterium]
MIRMGLDLAITVGSFHRAGGIERVSVRLAEAYVALGHAVTVYACDWDPAFETRFRFVRVPAPSRPAWLHTLVLGDATARRLARHDWVHGQGASTTRCDLLTYHTVHAAWLEISAQLAGQPAWLGPAKRLWPFHRATIAIERRQAARHRGRFHTCSQAVREEAIRHYGIAPERIAAIPWGIDLREFQPSAAARAERRAAWNLGDGPVLVMVANELHRKGLAPLLQALALLGRGDVTLLVAGRADPRPWLPLVERLGLGRQVRFLGSQPAAGCYQAADAFVMPTLYEGWSLVIGEALASGLPVVTSRAAGSSDLIRPGENGLLLDDPRDATAIAQALAAVLDPQVGPLLAAGARPSVADASWEGVAERLLAWGQAGA